MLNFLLDEFGGVCGVTDEYPDRRTTRFENRNDFRTFERAKEVSEMANLAAEGRYIPTDAGPSVSPRYDVVRAYEVGEKVSISFNGDAYPAGEIVRISASGRVITTTDRKFYRVGLSGSWRSEGTWFLARGHFSKQNPHL